MAPPWNPGEDGGGGRGPADIEARPRTGRAAGRGALGIPGQGGYPLFTVELPWVTKPPQATDFNLADTLAGRTSANTPALFPGAQQVIPAGNVAVIRAVSVLANGLLVTSDIQWTLLFNDVPKSGWNPITINPRAAGSVEVSWTPEETYIISPEGATIDWRVLVVDAGTYQVSVQYHGWFYPLTLHQAALAAMGAR